VQDDDPPHSFGIHYVTLAELYAERDERAAGHLTGVVDLTTAIALVEQYEPALEYVYVLCLAGDTVYTIVRFWPGRARDGIAC